MIRQVRVGVKRVTSSDGTYIAYDRSGEGPPLILVGGTLEHRALESETAKLAASPTPTRHFTLFHYDRRGRGDSTDTQPYAEMRQHPMWPMWETAAPTIAYDTAVVGEDCSIPSDRAARVAVPALVMNGEGSDPPKRSTAATLVEAMPDARHRVLEGQSHVVVAEVIAPVLVEFFTSILPVVRSRG